jgi:hypothetical protein
MVIAMTQQTKLKSPTEYKELAKLCLWEAGRTLDHEASKALRSLAERFERMSERARRAN